MITTSPVDTNQDVERKNQINNLQENREVINTWFKCLVKAMKKPGSKNAMDHADKAASMELKMTKKAYLILDEIADL